MKSDLIVTFYMKYDIEKSNKMIRDESDSTVEETKILAIELIKTIEADNYTCK